jgi:hypothetical protein
VVERTPLLMDLSGRAFDLGVVFLAPRTVGQHLVRLRDLPEAPHGRRITRVVVGDWRAPACGEPGQGCRLNKGCLKPHAPTDAIRKNLERTIIRLAEAEHQLRSAASAASASRSRMARISAATSK